MRSALTGPASVEWKLDGARVQVHRVGDDVRVYTRTLHEVGARLPEIVDVVPRPADRRHRARRRVARSRPRRQPAQVPGHDERRHDALQPFFFDVLHAGGESLIDRPLHERKAVLAELVPAACCCRRWTPSTPTAAEAFAATVARRRARGRDGQGARLAVPGRPARGDVAQGQAGAHASTSSCSPPSGDTAGAAAG